MRIEDTLDLTTTNNGSYAEHVGDKFLSIRNKDIGGLLACFNEKDIVIDISNSEKEISYEILGEKRKSMVPFDLRIEEDMEITKYILNNPNLKIEIEDYFQQFGGSRNIAGGSYSVKAGIMCKIMFEGPSDESSDGVSIVTEVKDSLKRFYSD